MISKTPTTADPRPARTRRRSALLSLIGCLAVVAALSATTPDPAQLLRSYSDTTVGRWDATREFDVRVTDVSYTRVVQPADGYSEPVHSKAVYVITTLILRSRSRSDLILDEVELHTADGHVYHPREEFISSQVPITPPGFTGRGQAVFEVPQHRLAGARLVIGPRAGAFDFYDLAVRVDLGLDRVDRIGSTPVRLSESRLEVSR